MLHMLAPVNLINKLNKLKYHSIQSLLVHITLIMIELGLNHTSTLVGHFVSSPREREKEIEKIVEEMKEMEREEKETEMKVKKQKK